MRSPQASYYIHIDSSARRCTLAHRLTFSDSLKAAKLVLVSRLLSRERDLFRWRGTLSDDKGVTALSPRVMPIVWSSRTMSRLLLRMPRPNVGRELRRVASKYLDSSTLALKKKKYRVISGVFKYSVCFVANFSAQSEAKGNLS